MGNIGESTELMANSLGVGGLHFLDLIIAVMTSAWALMVLALLAYIFFRLSLLFF